MAVHKNRLSEQTVLEKAFDEDYDTISTTGYGFDGTNAQRLIADNMALKITNDGSITYIGIAAPGTLQSEAKWQCKKLDKSSGLVITYADGDANFDNVATDLTALTYV